MGLQKAVTDFVIRPARRKELERLISVYQSGL